MEIRVNVKALAAAHMFKAKDDVRYYLKGILISPDPDKGLNIIGTDGHRMLIVHDPEGTITEAGKNDVIVEFDRTMFAKFKRRSKSDGIAIIIRSVPGECRSQTDTSCPVFR